VDWAARPARTHRSLRRRAPGDATRGRRSSSSPRPRRPLILAGHGVISVRAERQIIELAERAQVPIAVTLLRHRGVAASHPLQPRHDGHAREAWVNTAIQEADC